MIRSKKLKRFTNINHFFFNSIGGKSNGIYKSLNCGPGSSDNNKNVSQNVNIVSKKIGCKKNHLILLNQIHSNKIIHVKKPIKRRLIGDGLITDQHGIALGILTADCAPILFYDPKKNIIAAAHAGWRGAYKKIVIKIIKFFLNSGSLLKNLQVVIGPCIAQNHYEVKNDFKKKFIKQSPKNIIYFRSTKNKIFFSLRDYIKDQLVNFGIKNIEIIKKDTYNRNNNFFSSRRSLKNKKNDYGRNISLIMIK